MRSAIFDLDGTLVDTSGDMIAAANAVFTRWGMGPLLDPVADAVTGLCGGRAMLRLGLSRTGRGWTEAQVDDGYPVFLETYRRDLANHSHPYDGVPQALVRLADQGWRLGVCTNKPQLLADELLARLGLDVHFGAILGADARPWRKPDPRHLTDTIAQLGGSPTRAVMVGDTQTDLDAAVSADVPCILVGFGPGAGQVAGLVPGPLLPSYDVLPDWAERLVPGQITA